MRLTWKMKIAVALSLLPCSAAVHAQDVRTVALTGDAGVAGATLNTFFNPVLNNSGHVAFEGTLIGGVDATNDQGVWSEGSGSLSLVARSGDAAPGTGVVFAGFGFEGLVLNDAGQTAFISSLTGTGVTSLNNNGIWSEGQGGGLALVARAGDAAPGLGSAITFVDFRNQQLRLNNNGNTSISTFVEGGSNFATIWTEGSSGLNLVAQAGDIAPGTSAPWTDFNFSNPAFNDNGQVAFSGAVFVTSVQQGGIWRGAPGSVTPAALPNIQAPGTPAGVVIDFAFTPSLNNNGQVAFTSVITGTGVNLSNNVGIWTEGGGNGLALVAREGSAAAGIAAGIVYNGLSDPVINNAGDTAFSASLIGTGVDSTNDFGIWKDPATTGLELVARDGDQAAGTQAGTVFDLSFSTSDRLNFNEAGQIAFLSALTGTGVDATNDRGIWAQDLAGNLQLIAREGDLLEVFDDQLNSSFRTIDTLGFSGFDSSSGNGDGIPSSFNDLGQLAFFASFTDGSQGVFVSNLVAVPEPSTGVFVLSVSLGLLIQRRRQEALT